MKTTFTQTNPLLPSRDALALRDSLEAALTSRFPSWLAKWIGIYLTWLTGLAPTSTLGQPVLAGSEARSFAFTVAALILGSVATLFSPSLMITVVGGFALLHGMRSFSSVVGHHMTHGAKVIPGSPQLRRLLYDLISAAFLLPSFDAYKKDHQQHHAYAAGPDDADQQFIAYLGARFNGLSRFVLALLDPLFHLRFAKARLTGVLLTGPAWRRTVGIAVPLAVILLAPSAAVIAWLLTVIVRFQAATLMQWSTEHLWGQRPAGRSLVETATAVTFGRLLLPDPAAPGLWWKLPAYTFFRLILLSGDLPNHDLHHLGRGPWVNAPYIRTRLILEGKIELRQTTSISAMFRLAFDSAKAGKAPPRPPREMDSHRMLGM